MAVANAYRIDADHEVLRLIGQHYGSGEIYLTGRRDRAVLQVAIASGLVSEDGYLTNSGQTVWTDFLLHGRAPALTPRYVVKPRTPAAPLRTSPTDIRSQASDQQ
jgi:hypothetical protein